MQININIQDPWDWNVLFETEMSNFLGSDYAISCDSATNGFRSILDYYRIVNSTIEIPTNTYVSIANQITLSNNKIKFLDMDWWGSYPIKINYPHNPASNFFYVMDSACELDENMFTKYFNMHNVDGVFYMILSFHHRKIINIGRGGMILTNNKNFTNWAHRYIYDGRDRNVLYKNDEIMINGNNFYMTPEYAKIGLKKLNKFKEDLYNRRTVIASSLDYKPLSNLPAFLTDRLETSIIYNWNSNYYHGGHFTDFFDSTFYKKYIILHPQDYSLGDTNSFESLLSNLDERANLQNKKIEIYLGCEYKSTKKYKNISFFIWDSIDFFSKDLKFKNYTGMEVETHKKKKFTTMINIKNGREFRLNVPRLLIKKKLLTEFNACIRTIEYTNEDISKYNLSDMPFKSVEHENFIGDVATLYDEYYNSIIDFVVETLNDVFFVTEKTTRPIFYKKPFLVYSCRGFHQKLESEYNIKKFDDIFNYEFDDEPDDLIRLEKLIDELDRVNKEHSNDFILERTKNITYHNYDQLHRLKFNKMKKINDTFYEVVFNQK